MPGRTSSGLALCALAFAAIVTTPSTAIAFGESVDGLPSWEERVLHAWVNRARLDPTAELAGCSSCSDKACYSAKPPLVYQSSLNRAARLHATEMTIMGATGHDSACTLVADIATTFPVSCSGVPSCACVGGAKACSSQCSTWQQRVLLFGITGSHEVLGSGASPIAAFEGWMAEPWASGCAVTPEGRGTLLSATGAIGFGVSGTAVVADLSETVPSVAYPIVAGSHSPRQGTDLTFHAVWHDGWAATTAAVDIDGTCHPMTRERGSAYLGSWTASVSGPAATCRRYYFVFRNENSVTKTWPETGSLGIGDASCADFDASRPALPAACPCAPQCETKHCGDDLCGGSCGTCAAGEECQSGVCVPGDAGLDVSADGSSADAEADATQEAEAAKDAAEEAGPVDSGHDAAGDAGEDAMVDSGIEDGEAGGAAGADGSAGSSGKSARPKVPAGKSIADSADDSSCAMSPASRGSGFGIAAMTIALAFLSRRRSGSASRRARVALIACSSLFLCGADGGAPKPLGTFCYGADECESQFCVDNICCESACDKQCERCDGSGTCQPNTGAPQSPRPHCPEASHPSCAGTCDGTLREACTYPKGPQQGCDDDVACEGQQVTTQECNGKGECKPTGRLDCFPYTCWAASCTKECTKDGDCAPAAYCESYQCISRTTKRCDEDVSVDPDGTRTDCSPARCQADSGACVVSCTLDTECVDGWVCRDSACVDRASRPLVSLYDEDGCNCRAAGSSRAPSWAAFAMVTVPLLLLLRRRRVGARAAAAMSLLAALLAGCSSQEELPPGEVCEDVGYSLSNRVLTCTGDKELAVKRWEDFRNEYQCLVKTVDRRIEEYYVCPVEVRKTPCETVTAAGDDLDLWLGTVPICTEILAHTSGERIPGNGSQP